MIFRWTSLSKEKMENSPDFKGWLEWDLSVCQVTSNIQWYTIRLWWSSWDTILHSEIKRTVKIQFFRFDPINVNYLLLFSILIRLLCINRTGTRFGFNLILKKIYQNCPTILTRRILIKGDVQVGQSIKNIDVKFQIHKKNIKNKSSPHRASTPA